MISGRYHRERLVAWAWKCNVCVFNPLFHPLHTAVGWDTLLKQWLISLPCSGPVLPILPPLGEARWGGGDDQTSPLLWPPSEKKDSKNSWNCYFKPAFYHYGLRFHWRSLWPERPDIPTVANLLFLISEGWGCFCLKHCLFTFFSPKIVWSVSIMSSCF